MRGLSFAISGEDLLREIDGLEFDEGETEVRVLK